MSNQDEVYRLLATPPTKITPEDLALINQMRGFFASALSNDQLDPEERASLSQVVDRLDAHSARVFTEGRIGRVSDALRLDLHKGDDPS